MAKRAKLALILPIVLIIAWLVWWRIAHSRLQSKLDELAARHEPIHLSDLDFCPIPNNQNAAFYYQSAIAAMSNTVWVPADTNFTFPDYPPYPAMWHTMVDQAVAANQQSLSLARHARNFDRADWGTRLPQPPPFPVPFRFKYFNGARGLANLLGDGALQSHSHGDDAEAIQRIFDLLHLGDAISQRGFLIGRLVALGIQGLADGRIKVMATDLQMSPNRPEIIKLIHQLLDEQKYRDARQDMARYECAEALDESLALASRATILRPMIYLGAARIMDDNARFQLALTQTNWPAVEAIYGQASIPVSPFGRSPDPHAPRFSRFADLSFGYPYNSFHVQVEFRFIAEMRMSAVSLAVNLYRADHNRWPPDLKSLVPEYLPSVPEDPFYAVPHSIGYVIVNGSRPLLFCDTDGVPSTSSPPTLPSFGWSNNTGNRQWCDITNWWQSPPQRK
jgi:hypothetical protein